MINRAEYRSSQFCSLSNLNDCKSRSTSARTALVKGPSTPNALVSDQGTNWSRLRDELGTLSDRRVVVHRRMHYCASPATSDNSANQFKTHTHPIIVRHMHTYKKTKDAHVGPAYLPYETAQSLPYDNRKRNFDAKNWLNKFWINKKQTIWYCSIHLPVPDIQFL